LSARKYIASYRIVS